MQLAVITGAMVGALVGFIAGGWAFGEKCVRGAIETDCYPAEDVKVYLVTAVGLVIGLLTGFLLSRLRRSKLV